MLHAVQSQVRNQWMGALALFLVLAGGGAYAAFDPIGGDGDVDACFQKKSGDLDLRKGRTCGRGEKPVTWNQVGPQGEIGAPGAEGAEGAEGAQGETGQLGPSGVSGLVRVATASGPPNSGSGKIATAECPAGKRAIGAGAEILGGISGTFPDELTNVAIDEIFPSSEDIVPGSVSVRAFEEEATGVAWAVRAIALCANVS